MKGKNQGIRIALTVLGVLALALIGLFSFYMVWEKAPDIEPAAPTALPLSGEGEGETAEDDAGLPFDTQRQDGVYTILLVGNDDGTGNTDTIMVGKIDTNEHTMDFVSIPRDTLINVDWSVRKINSVYWGSKNNGGNGIDALKSHIKKLIGFDVDCYAVVDLNIFMDTVDALGGVYFDVPMALDYEDASQDLYIHIAPGYQLLDGYQAMGVCRFRSGYASGDIGRIDMQHQFLKACASQFISLGNIPNISKVVEILSEGLDTNLSAANIAFFLRQALLCDSEDINFYTAPNSPDMLGGLSYAVLDLWNWLPMVNEYLNPYEVPVEYGNVDIVYRDGGISCTTTLKGEWYYQTQPETEPEPETPSEPQEPETTPGGGSDIVVVPPETSPPVTVPPETAPPETVQPDPDPGWEIPPGEIFPDAPAEDVGNIIQGAA